MKSITSRAATLLLLTLVAACGGGEHPAVVAEMPQTGPAQDYPMVLGAPYVIGGVTYTPVDKFNYDIAGYAVVGSEGGAEVSVAERVLPMPSYVEITDLTSRRTILARVERRGPTTSSNVIEFSPGAAAQLGLAAGARVPVRVRRVNPPENERAQLRSGGRAPERIETPAPLAAVLLRRIPGAVPASVATPMPVAAARSVPTPRPTVAAAPRSPRPSEAASANSPKPALAPVRATAAIPTARPSAANAARALAAQAGTFVVQVGAFSTRARADTASHQVGGKVSTAGRLFRVRSGPFTTPAAANAALAKATAAEPADSAA